MFKRNLLITQSSSPLQNGVAIRNMPLIFFWSFVSDRYFRINEAPNECPTKIASPSMSSISLPICRSQHLVLPDAKVLLFGSRAYGNPTKESDWDILILTDIPVNSEIKKDIHKNVFPLSVEIGAFIDTLTVQQKEWQNNPSYYSLHQTIKRGVVQT